MFHYSLGGFLVFFVIRTVLFDLRSLITAPPSRQSVTTITAKYSELEFLKVMELKKLSKRIFITGTLLIWLIKFLIRPMYGSHDTLLFLLNIAPNLFGSFLIPFAAYWFFTGRNYFIARIFRSETHYELRLVCLMGFGMLIVNEYLQRIPFFGRTFDYNDITFSSVGLLVSCLVFGKLYQRYQVQSG